MEKYDFIDSKFRLALLAAKRAKQLLKGSRKRVDSHSENPLTIALQEIYQGKVNFKILEEQEMLARELMANKTFDEPEPDDFLFNTSTSFDDLHDEAS